jgi:hypothetical protein
VTAAGEYFNAESDPELQRIFAERIADTAGGAPETHIVHEH